MESAFFPIAFFVLFGIDGVGLDICGVSGGFFQPGDVAVDFYLILDDPGLKSFKIPFQFRKALTAVGVDGRRGRGRGWGWG